MSRAVWHRVGLVDQHFVMRTVAGDTRSRGGPSDIDYLPPAGLEATASGGMIVAANANSLRSRLSCHTRRQSYRPSRPPPTRRSLVLHQRGRRDHSAQHCRVCAFNSESFGRSAPLPLTPLVAVHAIVSSAWLLFFLTQATLVATGRTPCTGASESPVGSLPPFSSWSPHSRRWRARDAGST